MPATTEIRPALFVGPSDRQGSRPRTVSSRDAVGAEVGEGAGACARSAGAQMSASMAAADGKERILAAGFVTPVKLAPQRRVHNQPWLLASGVTPDAVLLDLEVAPLRFPLPS